MPGGHGLLTIVPYEYTSTGFPVTRHLLDYELCVHVDMNVMLSFHCPSSLKLLLPGGWEPPGFCPAGTKTGALWAQKLES